MPQDTDATTPKITFPEALKLYEDGKHRRYELLFAINGGAFAVAKLIGEKPDLGHLRLAHLAFGMTLFTAIMVVDIYTFGYKWHSLGTKRFPGAGKEYEIFGAVGRAVLIAIGLLIAIGWFLVSGCCS